MEAARVPVEFSKGEWGKGQEEINLRYADALEMADRHVLYKHGVKEIAWQQGSSVTFMAKYDVGAAGSSCHLHSSVWDQRRAAQPVRGKEGAGRARRSSSSGWPARWRWRASSRYFYAPTVNSYKRYQAGSFAPDAHRVRAGTTAPAASGSAARARGFRVENRIPGADANPYLAFAATIAAGLHGDRRRSCVPPALYEGNAYEDTKLAQVPKTLREALAELERLARGRREAFGPKVVDHYLRHGRLEQQAFDQAVTDWELIRLFERI